MLFDNFSFITNIILGSGLLFCVGSTWYKKYKDKKEVQEYIQYSQKTVDSALIKLVKTSFAISLLRDLQYKDHPRAEQILVDLEKELAASLSYIDMFEYQIRAYAGKSQFHSLEKVRFENFMREHMKDYAPEEFRHLLSDMRNRARDCYGYNTKEGSRLFMELRNFILCNRNFKYWKEELTTTYLKWFDILSSKAARSNRTAELKDLCSLIRKDLESKIIVSKELESKIKDYIH